MRVKLADPAIADLKAIDSFIGSDSPVAAKRTVQRILASLKKLADFPQMGRRAKAGKSRELAIPQLPYIAYYVIIKDVVWVHRILHGAMQWPPTEEE